MVHKRYVMKNGIRHGPYLYESYRDENGKVKKRYLGRHVEAKIESKGLFVMGFLFLLFLFSFSMVVKVFFRFIL